MKRLFVLLVIVCTPMLAQGANVYSINGSGTGGSAFDWSNPATWSDGFAATSPTLGPNVALNDYYQGRDENLNALPAHANTTNHVRAVNNVPFFGRSLHVSNPHFLSVRTPGAPTSASITVPDLYLTSGTISMHNSGGGPGNFFGKMTLGTATSNNALNSASGAGATNFRLSNYHMQIVGACNQLTLSMLAGSGDTITFWNTNNTFSLNILNQTGGNFQINGTGAAGNIRNLNSAGTIRPIAPTVLDNTTITLTAATGIIDIANNMRVANLVVDTTDVADGVYTAAQLNSQFAGRFTGGAVLTVGPPPPNAIRNWTNY